MYCSNLMALGVKEFYMGLLALRLHEPFLGRATHRATQKAVLGADGVFQHHSPAEYSLRRLQPDALDFRFNKCVLVHGVYLLKLRYPNCLHGVYTAHLFCSFADAVRLISFSALVQCVVDGVDAAPEVCRDLPLVLRREADVLLFLWNFHFVLAIFYYLRLVHLLFIYYGKERENLS